MNKVHHSDVYITANGHSYNVEQWYPQQYITGERIKVRNKSTSSSTVTSHFTGLNDAGAFGFNVEANSFNFSKFLPHPMTFTPCLSNAWTTAAPIPTEAPVTMATFPDHRSILYKFGNFSTVVKEVTMKTRIS